jgi:sporulation protein YlmC with PRC-barrel domain
VTFTRLRGHPLIDISQGKTIGTVYDVLLDEERRTIQAFSTKGGMFHKVHLVPAMRATIGADAVTFQPGALAGQDASWLDRLPRASQLIGMRVLSNTGQLLGTVEDIHIDPENVTLAGLELLPEQPGVAHRLGGARRLLPVNSIISYGPDTIIVTEGGDIAL